MRPATLPAALAGLLAIASCGRASSPDAWGNFEATDVTVSAETSGQLLRFDVDEGDRVESGRVVGLVDTTQVTLQLRALQAEKAGAHARTGQAGSEAAALESQLQIARNDLGRIRRLHDRQAATPQQLDQAESRVRTLEEQLGAARHQTSGTTQQTKAVDAQIAQLQDRLEKSRITSPVTGTVLATFAEPGEYVQPGQPLFRIAPLDTLTLRAWVSEAQLASLRLGGQVTVSVDGPDGLRTFPGIVSWVADEAEFTPTPVQTRDERADLVYAVKIRVANPDGALKIGMPADVTFTAGEPR